MTSVLNDVKKALGIDLLDESFDKDLVLHINTALFDMNQLGVGPVEGFSIANEDALWADILGTRTDLEAVKTCVILKVRLVFDPPAQGFVIASFEKQIEKLEWRICHQASPPLVVEEVVIYE